VLTVDVATTSPAEATATCLAVGAFASASDDRTSPPELTAAAEEVAEALGIDLVAELQAVAFDGSPGALARIPTRGAIPAGTVLVVGLGVRDRARADHLRRAAATAAGAAERVETLALALHGALDGVEPAAGAQAVAEGVLLGSYRFGTYRTETPVQRLETATLHATRDEDAVREGVRIATVTAASAALARDLVNTPPQHKRPPALADRVAEELEGSGVEVRILDEEALAEGGYGGIIGVGQGSSEPPRLVELTYAPDGATKHVALVGKGITFDTGGISLKPSNAMETMKMDMAGAATVAAVVQAAAALELPVKVTGLLALAENMPSGTATRVSDVLTMKDGTTVEVINTDAEGRLVLGDALVHASELEPDAIVDIATLTGAAVVALGERIGVLMASDDGLADDLLSASATAGEPFWRLPLATDEYGERLEGNIADLKNSGTRAAGTIFAGLFLHRFVGEGLPWAHLDIAGVAWTEEAGGYLTKGATGVPVRTLVEWLRTG
jgi:leucyl aminopeptidase